MLLLLPNRARIARTANPWLRSAWHGYGKKIMAQPMPQTSMVSKTNFQLWLLTVSPSPHLLFF
jgi:hypothetical protein